MLSLKAYIWHFRVYISQQPVNRNDIFTIDALFKPRIYSVFKRTSTQSRLSHDSCVIILYIIHADTIYIIYKFLPDNWVIAVFEARGKRKEGRGKREKIYRLYDFINIIIIVRRTGTLLVWQIQKTTFKNGEERPKSFHADSNMSLDPKLPPQQACQNHKPPVPSVHGEWQNCHPLIGTMSYKMVWEGRILRPAHHQLIRHRRQILPRPHPVLCEAHRTVSLLGELPT